LLLVVALAPALVAAQEPKAYLSTGAWLRSDDQPSTFGGVTAEGKRALSDRVWLEGGVEGFRLSAPDAGGRVDGRKAWAGVRAALGRSLSAAVQLGFRRVDDEDVVLGRVEIARDLAKGTKVVLTAGRDAALDSAPSYRAAVVVQSLSLAARHAGKRWSGAAEVWGLFYEDSNTGLVAFAWGERAVLSRGGFSLVAGGAVSWKDLEESRFRIAEVRSSPLPGGLWGYEYRGVYDPYVTPVEQLEARAHVRLAQDVAPFRFEVQAEWGAGRDVATGFAPSAGAEPGPGVVVETTWLRTYQPGRLRLAAIHRRGSWGVRLELSRALSADYASSSAGLTIDRSF
jgi:hypothetical protein